MSTTSTAFTAAQHASREARHRQRKRVNALALTLAISSMAFGIFW